jgi:cytochrome c
VVNFAKLACATVVLVSASSGAASESNSEKELYESRCGGCHSLDSDRVGPRHRGLRNRPAASVVGFDYSPALTQAGKVKRLVWTAQTLDAWLTDPEALVPGQAMNYSLANADERRRIVDYLLR